MSRNGSAVLKTADVAETHEVKIIPLQGSTESINNTVGDTPTGAIGNLPIEDLKNRAVALTLLNQKNDDLTEKRKRLDRFAIVHDQNNAKISVIDAQGEEFVSNSPKSIKKLIEFWQEEFKEAIAENETQIKAMFA
ncbi:hypothetical protein SAMD00024442_6_30 [Candidatus Symbiothrix dinenymphae]|nr:hypothetical protein SAMD00024442_6_30 [Candidatus Symbiothrix dinenymphae]